LERRLLGGLLGGLLCWLGHCVLGGVVLFLAAGLFKINIVVFVSRVV
jgi:hypothetical protein